MDMYYVTATLDGTKYSVVFNKNTGHMGFARWPAEPALLTYATAEQVYNNCAKVPFDSVDMYKGVKNRGPEIHKNGIGG